MPQQENAKSGLSNLIHSENVFICLGRFCEFTDMREIEMYPFLKKKMCMLRLDTYTTQGTVLLKKTLSENMYFITANSVN